MSFGSLEAMLFDVVGMSVGNGVGGSQRVVGGGVIFHWNIFSLLVVEVELLGWFQQQSMTKGEGAASSSSVTCYSIESQDS